MIITARAFALAATLGVIPLAGAMAQFGGGEGGSGITTAPGTLTRPTGSGATGRDPLSDEAVQSHGYVLYMQPRPDTPAPTRQGPSYSAPTPSGSSVGGGR